ncbi:MAG: hypothetical protein WBA18_17645 [Terracidiphilus sp.]
MESYLLTRAAKFNRRCVNRSAPFLAVLVLAAQVVAQNPIIPVSADQNEPATGSPQTPAATYAPAPPEISAPAPAQEEASLVEPQAVPFLALAAGQDGGQSSSQTMPAAENVSNVTKGKATNTKPPHHALGVTLAVVGVTALVAGAVLFAGEKSISVCNGASNGCNEARDTGTALMPIGAAVAVTGFYFQFHR